MVGSRRHNVGVTPLETLIDIVVHGQVFKPMPYDGRRLVATDTDRSVGEGAELRGPMLAILLMLTGRSVVLPQLSGPS
ncbi:hypothetical protein [Kribbella rubisoli]|uniref:hypothetical protein n=1 Tax=Kribbella rubisoli TaxID=3075929 RepID=UPI00102C7DA0|nr:hypothetical protein [Kribbella rubisoli]